MLPRMRRPTVPPQLATRPFTLSEAEAFGVSRRMLDSPAWRRLFRGVYVQAALTPTPLLLAQAVALVLPRGAVVAGRLAAALHGIPLGLDSSLPIEIVLPATARARRFAPRPGGSVVVRTSTLAATDVTTFGGVPVLTPLRTAFDLARRSPLVEAVVLLDAMTHRGLVTVADLAAYVEERAGLRGIRVVRRAVGLVEPGAESPMETRLRLVLVLGGLPAPVVQHRLFAAAGVFVARLDLAYPELRIAIEYDGSHHGATWQRDLERMYAVMAEGWWLRRYTATDVFHRPAVIRAEVGHALAVAA
jgi:hypothetical protein